MAQRIQTLLIDDLDGGEAGGTVRFGLDGTEYETGLSAAHSQELRGAPGLYLAQFLAGRRHEQRRVPRPARWRRR